MAPNKLKPALKEGKPDSFIGLLHDLEDSRVKELLEKRTRPEKLM
jgi:Mg/Co/Ni transporter MgtE